MKWFLLSAAAVLILALILGNQIIGQTSSASISGPVSDPTNRSIPGVTITLQNLDNKVIVKTLTDEKGEFQCSIVKPGPYRLDASLQGFQTASVSSISAAGGQTLRFNLVLMLESSRTPGPNNRGQIKDPPRVGECR